MREVPAEELTELLKHNFDYVLELGILQEPKLCVKPVYKFERAFVEDETIPEFCLIYSETDDPDEIYISFNSNKFNKILCGYKNYKMIFHGENGEGEFCESYYYNYYNGNEKNIVETKSIFAPDTGGYGIRPYRFLTPEDKNFIKFKSKDDYLNVIFEDFIENKIWADCGIIGVFDENDHFAGYLAYYGIAENIRDVSYIYIKEDYRNKGSAKKLLKYFKNKNIEENKISYYSYAENEISKHLAESCGFLPCAKRYEK